MPAQLNFVRRADQVKGIDGANRFYDAFQATLAAVYRRGGCCPIAPALLGMALCAINLSPNATNVPYENSARGCQTHASANWHRGPRQHNDDFRRCGTPN